MAAGVEVQLDAVLSAPKAILAVDEHSIAFSSATGVQHVNVTTGRCTTISSPDVGGVSAIAASATARLIATASSSDENRINLYKSGSTICTTLPGVPDLSISALAVSRDGSFVAAFGSAPSYPLEQYTVATGAPLRGSKRIAAPGLVTSASYCPGNKDRLVGSGPAGLFFFLSAKSFDNTETTVVTVPPPVGPVASATALDRETGAEACQAVLEDSAAAVRADEPTARVTKPVANTSKTAAAGRRGANVWTSHAWLDTERVVASTADGVLHIVAAASGAVLASVPLAELPVAEKASASGLAPAAAGTVVLGLAVTSQGVLAACSDGLVRLVTISGVVQDGAGGPTMAVAAAVACGTTALTSLAVMPGFDCAYVTSAGGAVYKLALPLAPGSYSGPTAGSTATTASGAGAVAIADNHSGPILAAAFLPGSAEADGSLRGAAAGSTGPLVTLGKDHGLRLWSAQAGQASPSTALTAGRQLLDTVTLPALPGSKHATAPLTCLSAHPRLPLVAVGTSGGRVAVFVVAASTAGAAGPAATARAGSAGGRGAPSLRLLYTDRCHDGPVCAVSWCSAPGSGTGLAEGTLVSVSSSVLRKTGSAGPASAGLVVFHAVAGMSARHSTEAPAPEVAATATAAADGAAPLSAASAAAAAVEGEEKKEMDDSTAAVAAESAPAAPATVTATGAVSAAAAFAHLATWHGAVTAVAWTGDSLVLGTAHGVLLAVPTSAMAAHVSAVATNGLAHVPAEISSQLSVLGRAGHALASVAVLYGSSAAGDVVLAAVASGPHAALHMLQPSKLGRTPLHAQGSGSGSRHGPASTTKPTDPAADAAALSHLKDVTSGSSLLSFDALYGGTVVSVSVSPGACTADAGLAAVGLSDGSVALLQLASAGAGRVSLQASSVSAPLHNGAVAPGAQGVAWSPLGRSLLCLGEAQGTLALLTAAGSESVEGGAGRPKGLPQLGTPLVASESSVLHPLVLAVAEEHPSAHASGSSAVRPPQSVLLHPGHAGPGAAAWAYPAPTVPERARLAAEAAVAAEHASARAALLSEVQTFRSQLQSLLSANDSAPSIERLPRTEYSLDTAAVSDMEAAFAAAVDARASEYAAEFKRLDEAIARVKAACVDGMESMSAEVRAVHLDTSVRNFPLPKRSSDNAKTLQQLAFMRTVELQAIAADGASEAALSSTSSIAGGAGVGAGKAVWAHLTSLIPSDADWLVHAGLLAPTTDPAAQLEALLTAKATGGAAAAPAAAPAAAGGAGSGEGGEEGGGAGGDKEKDGKEGDAKEDEGVAWEGEAVANLLYHPAAVRTPAQKRAQIAFLKELLRATRARFNAAFSKLSSDKADLVEGVRTRHARIAQILNDLGVPVLHTKAADVRVKHLWAHTGGVPEAAVMVAAGLTADGQPLHTLPSFRQDDVDAVAASAAATAAAMAAGPQLPNPSLAGVLSAGALPLAPPPPVARNRVAVGPVQTENGVMTVTDIILSASETPAKAISLVGFTPAGGAGGKDGAGAGAAGGDAGKAGPGSALASHQVTLDPELLLAPFVSDAERKRRAADAEAAAAAAGNKDDAPDRALIDMFNGRLQGKDEITLLSEALASHRQTCPFLDPTSSEYCPLGSEESQPEHKPEWDKYKATVAQLEEEKAKARNALLSELTKLTSEVRDMTTAFDDKCLAAAKSRAGTASCIAAVEYLCARLSASIAGRDLGLLRDSGIEGLFNSRLPLEEEAAVAHESFLAHEAAAVAALEAAKEADRALERGLRTELTTANGGDPLDSDVWKVLTSLYKKRNAVPSAPAVPVPGSSTAGATTAASSDPFAWADMPVQTPEQRAAVVRDASLKPLLDSDVPDGYGSALNEKPALWTALNKSRAAKIEAEIKIADAHKRVEEARAHRALLAAAYTGHKEALDGWAAAREALALQLESVQADSELLVRLKAGQDEATPLRLDGTPHPLGGEPDAGPVIADSVLVPSEVVESVNAEVRRLGQGSVDILQSIREFRKGLLLLGWEFGYSRAARADAHATHRDLQIMRAAGVVKEFVTGVNVAAKARDDVLKAEAKLDHLKRTHTRSMATLTKTAGRIASAVTERQADIKSLEARRLELQEAVALREGIVRSRRGARSVSPEPSLDDGPSMTSVGSRGSLRASRQAAKTTGAAAATLAATANAAAAAAGQGGVSPDLSLADSRLTGPQAGANAAAGATTARVSLNQPAPYLEKAKLLATVKKQSKEIAALKAELAKLQAKNFPAFPSEEGKSAF